MEARVWKRLAPQDGCSGSARVRLRIACGVAAMALAGCAGVSAERGHDRVGALVAQRTGHGTHWEKGSPDAAVVAEWVRSTTAQGLTGARAVEIALVNSPELTVAYEELGISQADLVQAGRLRNPSIGAELGLPLEHGQLSEQRFSITQDFLDLFVLPMRKEIARAQFEADTLRVADRALEVAAEAQKAVTRVQASAALVAFRKTIVEAARASADLAAAQLEAGNINELALSTARTGYEQARLELAQEELEEVESREQVNRLLGLRGEATSWKVAEVLPAIPASEPGIEHLEEVAIRERLDVASARTEELLLSKAVDLARRTRFFGRLEIGVDTHRDPDGPRVLGPNLVIELPIFDQRQGTIARLEAQHRQQERRVAGLIVDARSEVRLARARLEAARRSAFHYRDTVLPLRSAVLDQSLLLYNGMFLGPYDLLAARQAEVEAQRGYLQASRNYWLARADLERAVGGALPRQPAAAPPPHAQGVDQR
jgi:cobalt-zinc-cadmium efflux system outer membrane protein